MPDPSNLRHSITFTDHSQGGRTTERLEVTSNSNPMGGGLTLLLRASQQYPQKIAQRILNGEYIEIADLWPDTWRMEELCVQASVTPSLRPRKKPVTEILVWVECFSVLSAIITSKFPDNCSHI